MRRLRLGHAGIAISLLILLLSARAQESPSTSAAAQPAKAARTAYKGSGSCSAVACHGGIAPLAGSTLRRNEHTIWISDDQHSRAFQVLFDERSKRIAYNLAGREKPVPAPEDTRCLACHTTPRPESLLTATAYMNQDGVGCESCHGSAEKWLGMHTTGPGWNSIAPIDKQNDYGFMNTKNLVRRIELCAGCHVGQGARDGFPLRDVNHDLIAAGHPRLNFEFAAYQENQPKHWNVNKRGPAESVADFPAQAWALGQIVSARAALELVGSRSARPPAVAPPALPAALPGPVPAHSPWPEFAEFGCFSCHHSLADESWRRNRGSAGVPIGSPEWGSWYYPLTADLLNHSAVGQHAEVEELQSALKALAGEMCRPVPDAAVVKPMADKGIKALDGMISRYSTRPAPAQLFDAAAVEQLIDVLNCPEAWNKVASWDHAAQRYLALVPLNQSRGPLDSPRQSEQKAFSEKLHHLLDQLSFPQDYDSPRGFDPGRLPVER
jgi:hypothetical protein